MHTLDNLWAILRSKLFVKLVLEFLPLGLFFIFTSAYDIYVGTVVLMVATVIAIAIVWHLYRRVAIMAIITAVTGLIAGGMTLVFTDPMYVKLKPTIVSGLFGIILATGLVFNVPLFKPLLGEDLNLTDEGWRAITWRWMAYFFFIAALNEVVWRGAAAYWPHDPHQADNFWAGFKAFGLMPLTILYTLAQLGLLAKHRDNPDIPLGGADVLAGLKKSGTETAGNPQRVDLPRVAAKN